MSLIKKILCAVDFSDCSRHALTYAAHLADGLEQATLDVVHNFEYTTQLRPDLTAWINPNDAAAIEPIAREQAEQSTRLFLDSLPEDVRRHVGETHLRFGCPNDDIVPFAESHGYDLLVLGTHGHSALRRFLLGSVAEHVVRHAKIPVLTIRGGEHHDRHDPAKT